MNMFRRIGIKMGSNPRTKEEVAYIFNQNMEKVFKQYVTDIQTYDPGAQLPDIFRQFKDAGGSKQPDIIKPIIGVRKYPFIPRQEPSYLIPEYDLLTVNRFLNSESLFSRVVKRYVEQIMRRDFMIVSQDSKNRELVVNRIRNLEHAMSGYNPGSWTFRKFVEDITTHLVTYSNAYVHRKKAEDQSSGKSWRLYGHDDSPLVEPIAGLFVQDPVKMRQQRDQDGNVKEWAVDPYVYHRNYHHRRWDLWNSGWTGGFNQLLYFGNRYAWREDPNVVRFQPHEIDHLVGPSSHSGLTMAMPMIWPILADLKALRMMEENVEFLVYQLSTGILHGKVGNDLHPAQPGEAELFQNRLDNMEGNGSIVTSHRWTLELIMPKGGVIDLKPYLEWFLDRIVIGFGVNPAMLGLGESTNKASGAALHIAFQGSVHMYQSLIEDYITSLFDHFLYENGVKYWQLNDQNRVKYRASEIDIDKQVLSDNNTSQQWINNEISFNEMREKLGQPPISEHEGKFFKDFVTAENMEMQSKIDMKALDKQLKARANEVSNKTAPANQNGKQNGPKSDLK